jgi:hypothetical protein
MLAAIGGTGVDGEHDVRVEDRSMSSTMLFRSRVEGSSKSSMMFEWYSLKEFAFAER